MFVLTVRPNTTATDRPVITRRQVAECFFTVKHKALGVIVGYDY